VTGVPARVSAAVRELRRRPVPVTDKGLGCLAAARRAPAGEPVTADSLAADRPSLFGRDFTMPLLVLRESALRQNIERMAAYCAAAGVELAPHGKTTMAPQLFARQLAAGAWGMTAATIAQLQVYRAFGVPRVLLANELTDRAGIRWLASELAADPGFDCYAYVDSTAGVVLLDEELRASRAARALPVLVELGHAGGRTGCRSIDECLAVAKAVTAAGTLRLAGAAGFEGGVGHDGSAAALAAVTAFCAQLRTLGDLLAQATPAAASPAAAGPAAGPAAAGVAAAGPGAPAQRQILSAGGSAFFDLVVRELTGGRPGSQPPMVILRSGAYITHDHGYYADLAPGGRPGRSGPELTAALELWAGVLSRPEPGLAILGAGRRDVAFDQGMPVPLAVRGASGQITAATGLSVSKLDDQHAYLSVPASSRLAPGDLLCLGISHPCTTFDKWRVMPAVDDDYRVVDAIHTFF
jgi:D-serine deaminase-like pyridoxal phosphate-dependent protein